ncbi:hypothetical protein [Kutzneria sp. 744]|uniref:hypothetical protein n=1 Tax=Kutzneria sp. (strain 744) TaxID=345341 RepID=UPI0004BC8295|nr:hypothetical protein [Kutzneria sp. 744]
MSIEDLRARLIGIVDRLPMEQLLLVGNVFNECILDLAMAGDGSADLEEIRHFVANTVGEAMTKAEDTMREAQSRLSLYAALL